MRVAAVRSIGCVQDIPGHPEVDQENATALEPKNQILAATLDALDPLARELRRHLGGIERPGHAWVRDLDAVEHTPDQIRLEASADGLDLWKLGHRPSVAGRRGAAA